MLKELFSDSLEGSNAPEAPSKDPISRNRGSDPIEETIAAELALEQD